MAEPPESTLLTQRTNFLHQQIRLLSQSLRPSQRWKESSDQLSEGEIRDVLSRANQILHRHNNTVYDRFAVRNVAKEVENLYWMDGAPDFEEEDNDDDEDGIRIGDDLTTDHNIAKLSKMILEEYEELPLDFTRQISKLSSLRQRRAAAQRKLKSVRQLKCLLEPIRDPKNSVQPNLVTRDGVLESELARSRALGIRVAGRVAGMDGVGVIRDGDVDVEMVDEREKVRMVLGGR